MENFIGFIEEIEFIGSGSSPPPPPPPPDEYTTLKAAAIASAVANNAALWFLGKPADLVGNVYTDSAGTTQAAVSDPVGLLKDRNGNVFPATQTTSGAKPTIVQLASGYCALNFAGAHLLSHGFHPSANQNHTLIGAAASVVGNDAQRCLISVSNNDGVYRFPELSIYANPDGVVAIPFAKYTYSGGDVENYRLGEVLASPPVISTKKSGNTITLYNRGSFATSQSITPGSDTMSIGTIGSFDGVGRFFNGKIVLICAAAVAMSDADRQAIERFGAFLAGTSYL